MSLFNRAGLRWYGLWLVLGWGWVALVWYLSLTSQPLDIDLGTSFNDKIGHTIAYAWLMLWFGNLYVCRHGRISYSLIFIAMGILLEVLQGSMTSARQFSYGDMLANSLGVIVGYVLLTGFPAQLLIKIETIISKHNA